MRLTRGNCSPPSFAPGNVPVCVNPCHVSVRRRVPSKTRGWICIAGGSARSVYASVASLASNVLYV